ncbi:Transmembrane protein 199 [Trichoplax sp. H2]|uniref:Transmembrane protein 199 n=1 Tax=Trichoplax adhaerens TaxID=10228 RepID=B3S804_TRIAD|nr:hypothetical protein TRIADDRAFT_60361 [Trichoplax adhaerens]EDV21023.1 hypothetical protein TRIADDRAFT_60361 [Trichoplax adhaerens]RDD37462.1 Transmembrane protein 199 [Trichoplax sp. H2]|eukprot:XP_002116353.1 hypothetical protein TRIADDRAFT_60361 [Trichoplax adhaerens]
MEVVFTERLHQAAVEVSKRSDLPHDLHARLHNLTQKDQSQWPEAIPFQLVQSIHQYFVKTKGDDGTQKTYLYQLLAGSELYRQAYQPPKRNPELLARLERLKAQQANREYQEMVKDVSPKQSAKETLGKDLRSTRRQLSSIINFVITVASAFAFGFFASKHAFPNVAFRVLFGLFVAVVVAAAELYFMARIEI